MNFRAAKLSLFTILLAGILVSCSSSEKTEQGEWISLFDGETFTGWKMYNRDTINDKWYIENGMIMVSKEGDAIAKNTGFNQSIITKETFGNFEFELEYRMSPGGNSGIIYHSVEDTAYRYDFETGPEFQLLDDEDSPTEYLPHRLSAASYDMFGPDTTIKTLNPAWAWNKAKILYKDGHVEHWLNGVKVLEFTENSPAWEEAKARSKWVNYPDWATFKEGHIGLQDHGDFVAFRNIRIRRL